MVAIGSCFWIQAPRFRLRTPSLIDDWFGIAYSERAFHALLHGRYSAARVDFVGRYRPAYAAIWNYSQWHLLGKPSMATAAIFGGVRLALFLLAVSLVAALVVGGASPLTRRPIIWLAPFAVAMTPATAVDLARYGPSDPQMLGGTVIGLLVIAYGLRLLAFKRARLATTLRAAVVLTVGYSLYCFGVYSKETSVCLLVFVPFFAKWCTLRWGVEARRAFMRQPLVWFVAIVLAAPLVHMSYELLSSISAGRDPYPTSGGSRGFSVSTAVVAAFAPLVGAPGTLQTYFWFGAVPVAVAVVIAMARSGDIDAWLAAGVLTTGWTMTCLALSDGEAPSRYLIPWLVAVAAVGVRGILLVDRRLQIIVACIVLALLPLEAHRSVDRWVRSEQIGAAAVDLAGRAIDATCPLYVANVDRERRTAIPRLLPFARVSGHSLSVCADGSREAYVLTGSSERLPPSFDRRCVSGWRSAMTADTVNLLRCTSLRSGITPDQDAASGNQRIRVVRIEPLRMTSDPTDLFQPLPARE